MVTIPTEEAVQILKLGFEEERIHNRKKYNYWYY
jgi:hypothetical protein